MGSGEGGALGRSSVSVPAHGGCAHPGSRAARHGAQASDSGPARRNGPPDYRGCPLRALSSRKGWHRFGPFGENGAAGGQEHYAARERVGRAPPNPGWVCRASGCAPTRGMDRTVRGRPSRGGVWKEPANKHLRGPCCKVMTITSPSLCSGLLFSLLPIFNEVIYDMLLHDQGTVWRAYSTNVCSWTDKSSQLS